MICQRCGQPIDHNRGSMTVVIVCEGQVFSDKMFCLKCAMDLLDWAEQRDE